MLAERHRLARLLCISFGVGLAGQTHRARKESVMSTLSTAASAQSTATPRQPEHTLRRSALVGVLATAADFLMIALLVYGLAIAPTIANIPALSLGVAIQFWGNKRYAFRDPTRTSAKQASAFLAVEVVAFVLNAAFFHILVVGLEVTPLLARALSSAAVYFGFSYRLWQIIFRAPSPLDAAPSPSGDLVTYR